MNNNTHILLIDYFKKFISESENKKRLQKNGKQISKQTIVNYKAVLKNLLKYEELKNTKFKINIKYKYTKRNFMTEKRNYNKFYINFSEMLYKKNCTDNYVGMLFKVLKTFFLYLNQSKGFETGIFYRQFHVIKEEIPIIVLSQEQLKFLIKDKDFEKMLSPSLLLSKDLFVVGCTIGLRFSDLLALKSKNWIIENESHYIVTLSKKTSVETRIKIPLYIVQIINKYKSQYNTLLPPMSLNKFNGDLKLLCFMAGWDYDVGKIEYKKTYS
jgi:integrase